jgi:putative FmdB family regulatory protein
MPLYDYLCRDCGNTFEKLRSIKDADQGLECPHCHSAQIERLLSTFSSSSPGGCSTPANSRFR